MNIATRVMCGSGLALLAIGAAMAADPADLPLAVAAALADAAGECTAAGGEPRMAGAVQRTDLTGDGHEDFVLDVGMIDCDGAASIYGDREHAVTVFVGDGADRAAVAFRDAVFDAAIEDAGSPAAKLWLTVAGAACGMPPAADFASENFCDRALDWDAKKGKFGYAPVATVRMIR